MQGVIFAYAALELVGVAAGETAEPEKVVPRAVNSIMWRVGLFYVGSVGAARAAAARFGLLGRREPLRHRPVEDRRPGCR